jgi:hypothetical protein
LLNRIKGSFYTLFFILLNLVYLVVELSFNARILDVSASMSPDTDFGQLEIYGRTISAIGATILAWRLLVPFATTLNLIRLVVKFFIIALVVFPLVFMGQKKLVNDLVDLSSSETRRTAEILTLLKYGIANGFVEIEQLSMDDLTLLTAEGKMFITLSGLLAYNSDQVRDILEQKVDKIAGYAIATQQQADGKRLFAHYRYAREQVLQQFQRYQQWVNQLEGKQNSAGDKAIELYENAMNQALLPWLDYLQLIKGNKDIQTFDRDQLRQLSRLLWSDQREMNSCRSTNCFNQQWQQLELRLSQKLGFYSSLEQWCERSRGIRSGLRVHCVDDVEAIQQKIVELRKHTLALQAGLSRSYASKLEYLKSPDFRSGVMAYLRDSSLFTREDWDFKRYRDLLQDIQDQLKQRYLEEYQQVVIENFNAALEPRTGLERFNLLPAMQDYYVKALGLSVEEAVSIDLDRQQFDQRYLASIYFVRFNSLLNKLRAGAEWYADEAPYETSGKNSLRNLVVPAVAIAFSLVFALLNMINLLLNFVFLVFEEKLWLRWLGFLLLSGLIVVLPQYQEYRIYNQTAYLDLLAETGHDYGYWADALNWVAKTEPLVYPMGNILRYNLLHGFEFD